MRRTACAFALAAGAALASPLAALGAQTPNPSVLAMTEGLAKVCMPVDAGIAADLQQKATKLAQGLSEDELVELRNSREYQAAYQSITDSLGNSEQDARKACSAAPAAKR